MQNPQKRSKSGRIDSKTDERIEEQKCCWTDSGLKDRRTDGRTNRRTNGQKDRRKEEWKDGW